MIDFLHHHFTGTENDLFSGRWTPAVIRNWDVIREARQQVRDGGAYRAASAMSLLNRFALGTLRPVKWEIYQRKNLMTRYLYTHYPTDVQMKRQVLICTSCGGTGEHFSYHSGYDDCWHCNGTGIYRETDILAFTFHIDGKQISWHQPRDLVNFDVFIPEVVGEYEGEKDRRYAEDGDDFLLAYYIVTEFLWQNAGYGSRGGLWHALKVDLRGIKLALPHWCRYHWTRFVDEMIGDKPYYRNAEDDYGEIPF